MELPPGIRLDGDCTSFTSSASIGMMCDRAARMQSAHHLLPLLQAAARGEMALGTITAPDADFPTQTVARWNKPAVILIGDDPWPDGHSLGPDGWACARRLRYWAPRVVIVNGTGADAEHYRMAAQAAAAVHRVAMIETDSAHIGAWAAFFGCPNTVRIHPPAGCAHPDTTAREVVQ